MQFQEQEQQKLTVPTACGETKLRADFVTGHDFSRAVNALKRSLGFSP
jgi:hypothetical protein